MDFVLQKLFQFDFVKLLSRGWDFHIKYSADLVTDEVRRG